MKRIFKTTTFLGAAAMALSFAGSTAPAYAAAPGLTGQLALGAAIDDGSALLVEVKKGRSGTGVRGRDRDRSSDDSGRGRGRGGDDNRSRSGNDDRGGRDDNRSSGRDRPRIPGGSGCDDPGDILEHAECSAGGAGASVGGGATVTLPNVSGSGRDRVRIPGGSGCDDPGDVLEHPECRL